MTMRRALSALACLFALASLLARPSLAGDAFTATEPRVVASADVEVVNEIGRTHVLADFLPVAEPGILHFWATWCGPCHQIAPHIEQIAKEYAGKIKVAKLDVDKNQVISGRYNIRSIPTMIVFEGGQPAARVVGADANTLRRTVQKFAN